MAEVFNIELLLIKLFRIYNLYLKMLQFLCIYQNNGTEESINLLNFNESNTAFIMLKFVTSV